MAAKAAEEAKSWEAGDRVRVTKAGSQKGEEGTIEDPDWTGRVKVIMDSDGEVKSYLPHELENIGNAKEAEKEGGKNGAGDGGDEEGSGAEATGDNEAEDKEGAREAAKEPQSAVRALAVSAT